MTKEEIIEGLHQLSVDMVEIGVEVEYYYGLNPLWKHGREMISAGYTLKEWADEMEKK